MSCDTVQNNRILFSLSEHMKIKPIPDTTKHIYPECTDGQHSNNDVTDLFRKISTPATKSEKIRIKPTETYSTQLEPTKKKKTRKREICCKKKIFVFLCRHS